MTASLTDRWREAGAILDRYAYPLRSLCVVPEGMVLVVDGDDPLGPGQAVFYRHEDLSSTCWSGPLLRGRAPALVQSQPLAPTGYADLLRMIGAFASMAGWEAQRLVMGRTRLLLSYVKDGVPGEEILSSESVQTLLDEAFLRRAPGRDGGQTDRVRPSAQAPRRLTRLEPLAICYADRLAALGRYVARQAIRAGEEPREVLIEEIDADQILLVYRAADGTQIVTILQPEMVAALCEERRTERRSRRRPQAVVTALAELGAYLDAAHARAISAHQRAEGDFVLSYTAYSGSAGLIAARDRVRDNWAPGKLRPTIDLAAYSVV